MSGSRGKILNLIWGDEWEKQHGRKSEWKSRTLHCGGWRTGVSGVSAQEGISLSKTRTRKPVFVAECWMDLISFVKLRGVLRCNRYLTRYYRETIMQKLAGFKHSTLHSSRDAWMISQACVMLKKMMLLV